MLVLSSGREPQHPPHHIFSPLTLPYPPVTLEMGFFLTSWPIMVAWHFHQNRIQKRQADHDFDVKGG